MYKKNHLIICVFLIGSQYLWATGELVDYKRNFFVTEALLKDGSVEFGFCKDKNEQDEIKLEIECELIFRVPSEDLNFTTPEHSHLNITSSPYGPPIYPTGGIDNIINTINIHNLKTSERFILFGFYIREEAEVFVGTVFELIEDNRTRKRNL